MARSSTALTVASPHGHGAPEQQPALRLHERLAIRKRDIAPGLGTVPTELVHQVKRAVVGVDGRMAQDSRIADSEIIVSPCTIVRASISIGATQCKAQKIVWNYRSKRR